MAESAGAVTGRLDGVADLFEQPRTLSGWVVNSERTGHGRDITVSVHYQGRLLGQTALEFRRVDLVKEPDYMAGFRLVCSEDIPDAAIAFGLLDIIATDTAGRSRRLDIYDVVRARALKRLLPIMPPLTKSAVAELVSCVADSPALPEEARTALVHYRSCHLESDLSVEHPGPPQETASPDSEAEHNRALMFQFESLGYDCTLGSIQRHFAAEPLGLLRFVGIDIAAVTRALDDRFRGVGAPEFTRLVQQQDGEYMSYDSRYHMASHTFVFEGEVAFDRFYTQQCRKIAYLARKLMADLEEGAKVFVVHALPNQLEEAALQRLHRSLRAIGPGTLLYVQQADAAHPAGTLVEGDDGILRGYVIHSGGDLMKPWKTTCDSWLAVCRQAHAINQARQQAAV